MQDPLIQQALHSAVLQLKVHIDVNSVSVELQGEPYQLTLPMTAASSPLELKQAIAEACLANLGAEVTPEAWLEEDLSTLNVQLLDDEGEPMIMRDGTDFGLVLGSETLRVTERRQLDRVRPME